MIKNENNKYVVKFRDKYIIKMRYDYWEDDIETVSEVYNFETKEEAQEFLEQTMEEFNDLLEERKRKITTDKDFEITFLTDEEMRKIERESIEGDEDKRSFDISFATWETRLLSIMKKRNWKKR